MQFGGCDGCCLINRFQALVLRHRDRRLLIDFRTRTQHRGMFMIRTTIAGSLPKPGWLAEPEVIWAPWRLGGPGLVEGQQDAALAWIDGRYRLRGVVTSCAEEYSVSTRDLDAHLVPTRDVEVTREALHASGRGVACTKSPFAYLFERIA